MTYKVGEKVRILSNERQPWTVGEIGLIEEQLLNPGSPYRGRGPYYYVRVEHSESSSSGCVLEESELAMA